MKYPSAPLRPRKCGVCDVRTGLRRCGGCQVVYYCGRVHQAAHRDAHKKDCKRVQKSRETLEEAEEKLWDHPADLAAPPNVLEHAGHLGGLFGTCDYMNARFSHAGYLMSIQTVDAVQTALDHLLDMIWLDRSDTNGLRNLIPPLYLRLGMEQECYDFIKWWWQDDDEPWVWPYGDPGLTFLDLEDEDAFESIRIWTETELDKLDLSQIVTITLLKIRLLLDIKALQAAYWALGGRLPRELLNMVNQHLVGAAVASRRDIMDAVDLEPHRKDLEDQVKKLFSAVHDYNKFLWPLLLSLFDDEDCMLPSELSFSATQEAELAVMNNFEVWKETPGSLDTLRNLLLRDS